MSIASSASSLPFVFVDNGNDDTKITDDGNVRLANAAQVFHSNKLIRRNSSNDDVVEEAKESNYDDDDEDDDKDGIVLVASDEHPSGIKIGRSGSRRMVESENCSPIHHSVSSSVLITATNNNNKQLLHLASGSQQQIDSIGIDNSFGGTAGSSEKIKLIK